MVAESRNSMRAAVGTLLFLLLGPITWALHFGMTYALQSVTCAMAPESYPAMQWVAGAATLLAAGTAAVAAYWPLPFAKLTGADRWAVRRSDFLARAMRLLALLALIAIVTLTVPLFLLVPCGTLR